MVRVPVMVRMKGLVDEPMLPDALRARLLVREVVVG